MSKTYKSIFKISLLVVILFFSIINAQAQEPEVEWSKFYHLGPVPPRTWFYFSEVGTSVHQVGAGYIIGARSFFPDTNANVSLIKTDANGNKIWDKTFKRSGFDNNCGTEPTSDGGYIILASHYPYGYGMWLIKTDANGNKQWDASLESQGVYRGAIYSSGEHSVKQTNDGGFISVGTLYNCSYISCRSALLVKTDSAGNKEWHADFGVGQSEQKITEPNLINLHGFCVQQTSDNGYIIAGRAEIRFLSPSFFLIKTDPQGKLQWYKIFPAGGTATSIQQTFDGGYIVTGLSQWGTHLLKTDANGDKVWDKILRGSSSFVSQIDDGGYLTGGSRGSTFTHSDLWIAKTDSNGNQQWEKVIGGYGDEVAYAALQTADGGYTVVGYTGSGYVLGQPTSGYSDVWLIKLKGLQQEKSPISPAQQTPQKDVTTVGEPINVANGNMFTQEKNISIPSSIIPLELSCTYNSQDNFNGIFGYGWRSNFDITLTERPDASVIEIDETGVYTIYTKNPDGSYAPSAGKYSQLTKKPDGTFVILRKHGVKLYFNSHGLLTRIEDRNANFINITRGSNGVIQEVTDSSARKLIFTANAQGKITQVTDPEERIFKYEYDSKGNLVKTIGPLNNETSYLYDSNHNLIQQTDVNNHSLYFEYDANDRAFHSWQDDQNNEVTLAFDPANKTTTTTDSLGNATKYEYNDYGLVTKITDAQGNTQLFTWDSSLNKTSSTNQNGSTTPFTYDSRGNLLTVKDALNNTTTFTYEPDFDFISSSTDPLGNKTEYSYDAKGNLKQIKDALNSITTYSYDSLGRLIQVKDAKGNITNFVYDARSNLIQITDSQNHSTNFTYDILGNRLQTTDAEGNAAKFTYDSLNRLIQITYPDNSKATYAYDPVGNLISFSDQNSNTTFYIYDAVGRLIQITEAQGNITKYTYDTEGNRASITDAAGNTTQYFYNSLNRLIKTQDALNSQTLFFYDPTGNLILKTDANGNTINYTYDVLNRLLKKQYPNQTEETFTYDAKGALLTAANPNISYNYTYDPLSQLISADGSNNRSITYAYDAVGNRIKMTTPEGKAVSYSYDSLNRLSSIMDIYNKATTYNYDSLSRRTNVTLPNQAQASYSYDALKNLLSLTNKTQSEEVISSYAYTYDKAGNRLTKTEPDLKTSYTYDVLYRLAQTTITKLKDNGKEKEKKNQLETYTYDVVGNRLTDRKDTYSYNSLNQLLTTKDYSYEYDKNGNLIKKTETDEEDGKQKTCTFTYDYENRLIKVEIKKENKLNIVSFTYDPFNRRISKTVQKEEIDDDDNGKNDEEDSDDKIVPRTTYYVYDSEDIILEYNQKGKIAARYTHGPSIDEPISIERNNKLYYYHYDGLGSVTSLTNRKGKTAESYSYDSFGNLKRQGNKVKNSFTYTGREYDRETGLYYYRNRYYDPKIGRFLTQDPIGMIDGPNLYTYCNNNPINFVDPFGWSKNKTKTEIIPTIITSGLSHLIQRARNTNILWGQVGSGVVDFVGGVTGAIVVGKLMIVTSPIGAAALAPAFVEAIGFAGYGLAEIGTGFSGTSMPSSIDILKEILRHYIGGIKSIDNTSR